MKVITLPASLDERTFDAVVRGLEGDPTERRLFDARHVTFADPYGMVGLLAAGEVAGRTAEKPILQLPDAAEVGSYLTRMRFHDRAEPIFEVHGTTRPARADGSDDVLLEITPVQSHADVHEVVHLVNDRGQSILTRQLHYPQSEAFQFSVVLSEVCQNIIEHAEAGGWVAAQRYTWAKRLGRKVVVIAVMDLGIGFRASLASAHAARHSEQAASHLDDAGALEAAFLHGQTRHHDPGRGQGLQQIRKMVRRWGGRISIRSGSARIADVPEWDDGVPLERGLPPLPGAQIGIVLPARVEQEQPALAVTRGRER